VQNFDGLDLWYASCEIVWLKHVWGNTDFCVI